MIKVWKSLKTSDYKNIDQCIKELKKRILSLVIDFRHCPK